MKRIVRLTESDLTRIVKRVINEQMFFGTGGGMKLGTPELDTPMFNHDMTGKCLTYKSSAELTLELFGKLSRITEQSSKTFINEQWQRDNDGPLGYWKILYNTLKAGGIGVKWEVANDPVKSTFMYWGPWVISKDINKNGGWPVSFTSTDKKLWLFKFSGGKYAGQPLATANLESKNIGTKFNLGVWGKLTAAIATPQFNKLSISKPKTTVTGQTNQLDKTIQSWILRLNNSMKGLGSSNDLTKVLSEIKTKEQMSSVLNAYNKKFGKTLYEDLSGEYTISWDTIWGMVKRFNYGKSIGTCKKYATQTYNA